MSSQTLVRIVTAVSILVLAPRVYAQGTPSGGEIAQKAAVARLVSANAVSAQKSGQRYQVTTISADGVRTATDLDRKVLGVLRVDGAGEGLPPGTYHIFVAKVGAKWHAYLEAGGRIALEAKQVDVETNTTRPEINLARADGSRLPDAVPAVFTKCTKVDIRIFSFHLHYESGCD